MKVLNVHSRLLRLSMPEAEALLRELASHKDRLWPGDKWWPQHFDDGLVVGAKGGHGPVRYKVESVQPRRVVYRFPSRGWFRGTHGFEVAAGMTPSGPPHSRYVRFLRRRWLKLDATANVLSVES